MSMVPTSGTSVAVAVLSALMLMSTSVDRARHHKATTGSPPRAERANDGQQADVRSPCDGTEYEPAFPVAPRRNSTEDAPVGM